MRYKEIIKEKVLGKDHFRNVNIDLGNFYANMDDLKASGLSGEITDRFQSIDALTRLGLFATKEFRLFPPTEKGASGAFNASRQDIRIALDYATNADQKAATGTLMHELRHSAFASISRDSNLRNRMPDDLKNLWRGGWGANIDYDKWTVIARNVEVTGIDGVKQKTDQQLLAAPEHAMIYSIQHSDPMNHWTKIFFTTHPAIKDYDIDYWRDLYNQANQACEDWFRDTVTDGRVMQGTYPSKGSSSNPDRSEGRNFTLSPTLERWYAAILKNEQAPRGGNWTLFVENVGHWNKKFNIERQRRTTPERQADLAAMATLLDSIARGHLAEVPKWHKANADSKLPKTKSIWRTLDEFYFEESPPVIDWNRLDIRNFSKEEIDTAVTTGELPTAVEPENPVAPTYVPPTGTPTSTPNRLIVQTMIKTHVSYIGNPSAASVSQKQLEQLADKHGLDKDSIPGLIELFKQGKSEIYSSNVMAWAGV